MPRSKIVFLLFTFALHILQCPLLSPSQAMPPFCGLGTKYRLSDNVSGYFYDLFTDFFVSNENNETCFSPGLNSVLAFFKLDVFNRKFLQTIACNQPVKKLLTRKKSRPIKKQAKKKQNKKRINN